MAVRIRLARKGAKKKPFYRIVAADSEAPRDGKFIEIIGTYNPLQEPPEVVVKEDKLKHWLGRGARLSDTVRTLLTSKGLLPK